MKKHKIVRALFVLVLLACGTSSFGDPGSEDYAGLAAPLSGTKTIQFEPIILALPYWEPVAFTGQLSASYRWSRDGSGAYALRWSADFSKVEGRGIASGSVYRIMSPNECVIPFGDVFPQARHTCTTLIVSAENSQETQRLVWGMFLTAFNPLSSSPDAFQVVSYVSP